MEVEQKKDDGLGASPPEKLLRNTPSRTWENAILERRVKVAIIVDFCAQKEN